MTGAAEVAALWRHPIKGLGSERLASVELAADRPMPFDRAFALRHAGAGDHSRWQPRRNFLVVANGPELAQVSAEVDSDGAITLTHPKLPPITVTGTQSSAALIAWVAPIWPAQLQPPAQLVAAPETGMADHEPAQVSLMSAASLRALSQRVGRELDQRRFRGNIWLDGLAPWEEFDLVGRTIRLGAIEVEITDRIARCRATEANPETGQRDVDVTGALHEGYGHCDFGVLATVRSAGRLDVGDSVDLG